MHLGRRVPGTGADLDELEGLYRLELALLVDLEIGCLQIGHMVAVAIGHDGVDPDEVDARSERPERSSCTSSTG